MRRTKKNNLFFLICRKSDRKNLHKWESGRRLKIWGMIWSMYGAIALQYVTLSSGSNWPNELIKASQISNFGDKVQLFVVVSSKIRVKGTGKCFWQLEGSFSSPTSFSSLRLFCIFNMSFVTLQKGRKTIMQNLWMESKLSKTESIIIFLLLTLS